MKQDCIFFKEHDEDLPEYHVCKYRGALMKPTDKDCDLCRLWDAYIPESASEFEKEKALTWLNMPFNEQPDYEDYF